MAYLNLIDCFHTGDLLDIDYYCSRECAHAQVPGLLPFPCPDYPDYAVYCATCDDLVYRGESS